MHLHRHPNDTQPHLLAPSILVSCYSNTSNRTTVLQQWLSTKHFYPIYEIETILSLLCRGKKMTRFNLRQTTCRNYSYLQNYHAKSF